MLSEKGQFPYSFLIFKIKIFKIQYSFLKFGVMNLLTQNNNSYFIISLVTAVVLFSKPLSDCTYWNKLWNRWLWNWKVFWKKDVSRTFATSKVELFVALVNSFQPLTNFTKNSILCCYRSPKSVQVIKLGNFEGLQSTTLRKIQLFHRLMNYLNSFSDHIYISYSMT